jgi:hypothetical protein
MATNALQAMQDMANAPWLQNGMTQSEYARGLKELEDAARKHDNDPEPEALPVSRESGGSRLNEDLKGLESQELSEEIQLPEIAKTPQNLIYHDFDYINPVSKQPEGTVFEDDFFFPKISFTNPNFG